MEIYVAKFLWKEKKGFSLYRENLTEYIFIHFLTPVKARLGRLYNNILPGGCVIFAINSPQEFSSPDCELIHDWFHADLHFGDLMNKYGVEPEKVYYPEDGEEITEIVRTAELEYMRGECFYREAVRADAAGYNSEYNFIRQFKEHTGVTPGHYKK